MLVMAESTLALAVFLLISALLCPVLMRLEVFFDFLPMSTIIKGYAGFD